MGLAKFWSNFMVLAVSFFRGYEHLANSIFFLKAFSHSIIFDSCHSLCLSVPFVARLRKSQKYPFVIFLQVMSEHNLLEPEYLKLTFNTL